MAAPSPDRYEQFVRLFTQHEAGLRAFVRTLLPHWQDVDEVMQEVGIIAWRKFDQFDLETDFRRWGAMIARYEVMKYRRGKARDRLRLDDDILELLADEGLAELEHESLRQHALSGCLQKLPAPRRKLVLEAYAPGQSMKDLAAALGKTETALYQLLRRIRQALLACIERSVAQEECT